MGGHEDLGAAAGQDGEAAEEFELGEDGEAVFGLIKNDQRFGAEAGAREVHDALAVAAQWKAHQRVVGAEAGVVVGQGEVGFAA